MSNITKQKGASSSTPSYLTRWLTSKTMNYISSEKYLTKVRRAREQKRRKACRKHVVEYFHQVDDGYSHLAIQMLAKLKNQYDIELISHLVPSAKDDNFPEPELWQKMALTDAIQIAPYYNLEFADTETLPSAELILKANAILCNLNPEQFSTVGVEVSRSLWSNDKPALCAIAKEHGEAGQNVITTKLQAAVKRRAGLKHYGSAMFYYEGEWYWGIDRLYHLEQRLKLLGAAKKQTKDLVAPRPAILMDFTEKAHNMTLEYYVSLRSPYTAISWDPTLEVAKKSGINLKVLPVLPMVMRGVPATREKKLYIATDSGREARAMDVEYGNFYDPIGEPVLQGYSLYAWASKQGKGILLLGAFLKAAFAKGINTNSLKGIKKVVEMAGLEWAEAKQHLNDDTWQALVEDNRLKMYQLGSWGVPSYRLIDSEGKHVLSVWGQDRLWLVAQKIKEFS